MPVFRVILVRIFLHSEWIRIDTVSLRIQSECGKIRTRITPNRDTFLRSDNQRIKKLYAAALVKECPDLVVTRKQNLPFADVLQNWVFSKFHNKTPVLDSIFNKVTEPLSLHFYQRDSIAGVFLWIFVKFSEHFFTEYFRMAAPAYTPEILLRDYNNLKTVVLTSSFTRIFNLFHLSCVYRRTFYFDLKASIIICLGGTLTEIKTVIDLFEVITNIFGLKYAFAFDFSFFFLIV